MTAHAPHRYVPTLTEVVGADAPTPAVMAASQEQLVHRILQRVDRTLDRSLGEAIGTVVLEQTRSLAPLLRAEIEAVVRRTVAEAVVDELAAHAPADGAGS